MRELQRISEQNLQEKLLEVKPKKISKEVFNKIMEEHISFVKNKMYERIQQNLINVTLYLSRKLTLAKIKS